MEENKIKALLQLLNDDDSQTFELIRSQIMDIGSQMMPYILEAQHHSIDEGYNARLTQIYNDLNLENATQELIAWQQNNYKNLFHGLTVIAKYQYPRLEMSRISGLLNKIRQDAWLELKDTNTALEKVKVLNQVFFNMHSYHGNVNDYYAPENSFINDVLLQKKGNPIALSALYSIVAQSLGIPIYGVNTPRNFMLVYLDKTYSFPIDEVQEKNVLFYINPYGKGEVHSMKDIFGYLKRINQEVKSEFYLPCSNSTIIKRSINNIIVAFDKKSRPDIVANYTKLLSVFG